ncbi:MAG: hypothetical protein V7785_04635 [Bermanella sp.]
MEIPITEELELICFQIKVKNYSVTQWSDLARADMFQYEHISGGFDKQENRFCFSYYSENDIEYWFQLSLQQAIAVANGKEPIIMGYSSE